MFSPSEDLETATSEKLTAEEKEEQEQGFGEKLNPEARVNVEEVSYGL